MEGIELFSGIVEGLNGPGEVRSEAEIELKAFLSEHLTSFPGLPDACIVNFKPVSVNGISLHPLKRFSLFHMLSPCLRKTTLC